MRTGTLNAAHAMRAGNAVRAGGDRCPTTNTPHRASDGQILRLRLPGGRLSPAAAAALARAAAPGDSIELTSRGNLQLRGLSDDEQRAAQAAIAEHGLAPSAAHERARTILASPLVGRLDDGPIDDAFIRTIDAAICARTDTTALSGRVLTVIDDGAGHSWGAGADLLLRWDAAVGEIELRLGGRRLRGVAPDGAPAAAAELLGAFATTATRYGVWRASELPAPALASFGGRAGAPLAPTPPLPLGEIAQQGDRWAVRTLAPFGRLTAAQLSGAAALAASTGTDVRIDHERGLTLVDLKAGAVDAVLGATAQLGLITSAHDPAVGLTGCAGRDCTRTEVDVRAALALRAAARRPGAPREHLVGCGRRCGAPADGATIVADPADTPDQLAARAAAAHATPTAENRPC